MIISQKGVNLIKYYEGLRLKAYMCSGDKWTIGYGHTANVKPEMMISEIEAERFLKKDLVKFEHDVQKLVRVPLNQGQYDALVSFCFNVGGRAFSTSTLLKKLNGKDYAGAAGEFDKWIHAGGEPLTGLANRRRAERELFES